jgi:hypothetical protein
MLALRLDLAAIDVPVTVLLGADDETHSPDLGRRWGTNGHTVRAAAGHCGERRGTAGNGGERQGKARTIAWTQPSISRSIGWTAGRPRLHSPGQLHGSTLEVAAAAASKLAPHRWRSMAAISVSADELPMS